MLRRSFRIGLRMGLVAGILVVVVKVVQARRTPRDETWPLSDRGAGGGSDGDKWPPVQPAPVEPEPPATTVTDRIPPVKKAAETAAAGTPPAPGAGASEAAAAPPAASAAPAAPTAPVEPGAPDPDPVAGPQPAAKAGSSAKAAKRAPAAKAAPTARRRPGPDIPAMPAAEPGADPAGAPTPPAAAPARRARKDGTRRVRRSARPWIETTDHDCPPSHPVKAKLSSMLYHLPGMAFYNRTRPDRCYVDAAAAEADGFTRAKR